MFKAINCHGAWQNLDFVTESFTGDCAGQKKRVEKNATTKGQVKWSDLPVFKTNGFGRRIGSDFCGEHDRDVGQAEFRVVDEQGGGVIRLGESDFPWPVSSAAVFDPKKDDEIRDKSHETDD